MRRKWGTQKTLDLSSRSGEVRGSARATEGISSSLLCWRCCAGFLCRPDAPHKKQEIRPAGSAGLASIETSPVPAGSIKSNPQGPTLTARGSGLFSPSSPNHRPSPRPAAWLSRSETGKIPRTVTSRRTASKQGAGSLVSAGCSCGEPARLSCTRFQDSRAFSDRPQALFSRARSTPPPRGEVYTPILGHRSSTGQTEHFGLRAVQILRP